ncbi:hypothetical protein AC249_AIPGENE20400 [Exaiptasia diaphana]|nr:hypothetical protein AC249_AIPGENE20400 [Exaiptasia diaphana]
MYRPLMLFSLAKSQQESLAFTTVLTAFLAIAYFLLKQLLGKWAKVLQNSSRCIHSHTTPTSGSATLWA